MKPLYWIRRLVGRVRDETPPLRTLAVADIPENPKFGAIYLLGLYQKPWAAAFLCPCGCGALIKLNLLPEARPCWHAKQHWDASVSLTPSVERLTGCRSHFWVRRGLIEWAYERRRMDSPRASAWYNDD